MNRKIRVMLARDEADRRYPYDDVTGKPLKSLPTGGKVTIGIGRNLSGKPLSDAVVNLLLAEDVAEAEQTCKLVFGPERWEEWPENRCFGWINFAFNLGHATMISFKRALNAAFDEKWEDVDKFLRESLWYRQVGERGDRVITMICRSEFPYE